MQIQREYDKAGDTSISNRLTPQDARSIAKEAYIYAFPMAANYQTMYKQAIDKNSPDYRGLLNSLNSSKSVATPEDKESNWLPAPEGPFYAIYRVYMPGEAVISSTWKKPQMHAVAAEA